MENGSEVSEMDLAYRSGQMVLNMKGSGKTIELMGRESSLISMEISMMASG